MKIRKSVQCLIFMVFSVIIAFYGMATDNLDFELFGMYGTLAGWVRSALFRIEKLEEMVENGN